MSGMLFGKKANFSCPEVRNIVGKSAIATAAVGPTTFIQGADLPLVGPILARMVVKIAGVHGVELDMKGAMQFATVVISAASSWLVIRCIVPKVIAFTGVFLPVGIGINRTANACFTYRVGAVFDALCSDKNGWTTVKELSALAFKQVCPLPSFAEIRDCISMIRNR